MVVMILHLHFLKSKLVFGKVFQFTYTTYAFSQNHTAIHCDHIYEFINCYMYKETCYFLAVDD